MLYADLDYAGTRSILYTIIIIIEMHGEGII